MAEFLIRTRITQRDLRVARWVAEQQGVRLDTIAQLLTLWGSASQPRNLRRLAERWEEAGLIKRGRILADTPSILWPTSAAMRLTDLDDKRVERMPSISTLHHTLAVARVRLEYERTGADWVCERALRSLHGDQHLADGMATLAGQKALVEVDRTRKKAQRLRTIMATNARTPGIDLVHYWTTDELHGFITQQVGELDDGVRGRIHVQTLPREVQ